MRYDQNTLTLKALKERLSELDSSPEILTEAEWDELTVLRALKHDLAWCWDEEDRILIHQDHFQEYMQEWLYDAGYYSKNSVVAQCTDWEKVADVCRQDYKQISLINETFYTRA